MFSKTHRASTIEVIWPLGTYINRDIETYDLIYGFVYKAATIVKDLDTSQCLYFMLNILLKLASELAMKVNEKHWIARK